MPGAYERIMNHLKIQQQPVTSKQISEDLKIPRRTVNDILHILVAVDEAVKTKTKYSLPPPVDPATIVDMSNILKWVEQGMSGDEIVKRVKEAYSI